MYRIEVDRARGLLLLTLGGFWSVEEAAAFAREEQAAVVRLGVPAGSHLILADVTDFAVQTQAVSAVIRDLVLHAAATARRIALVGTTGLSALQSKRITVREGTRFFTRREEALAWLLDDAAA